MSSTVRSLDHFVIVVRDLDSARSTYGRLGFHALPRARHIEIGSSNHVIQLQETYLELVGDLEKTPALLRERILPRFSCGEGLAIVSLTSSDLAADHQRISEAGFAPARILNARRKIRMPSGSEDETDSSCFYVWRADRLFSTLFFSEHRRPQTIWVPQYQRHANTARRVTALTYLSDNPAAEVDYVSHLLGTGPRCSNSDHVSFETARGETIEFLTHALLSRRLGDLAPSACPALNVFPVGVVIEVGDLKACESALLEGGVPISRMGGRIVVRASHACGVLLEFKEP